MGVLHHTDYAGSLHCQLTHEPSGSTIETDAPKDNAGKGEAFSPTDLLAAALASCAITTMAIKAPREGVPFSTARATVEKIMTTEGLRRVARLRLAISLPEDIPTSARPRLEEIARTCPVSSSLSPGVAVDFEFAYGSLEGSER
ncbi:MAG: OsmC family protein [Myxococcales bacterium]|nr:OsmC family protein [Myxococcales bacterium]